MNKEGTSFQFTVHNYANKRIINLRNTCTQEPLARLSNLFSVITVILLINMPIPFKFDSCKNFATNLNAASSLGLGSKKCSKHFTLVNNIPSIVF